MEKDKALRIDQVLVNLGFTQSRERSKALIKKGGVFVNGKKITKASFKCLIDSDIEVKTEDIPWVSRGGLKMKKALDTWSINVKNLVCLDIGASTGGFTDVLLHNGAKKVYALDVGHSQLAEKLRNDKRVVVIENKNIRDTTSEIFTDLIDLITVDVSFISLSYVVSKVFDLLGKEGVAIMLIKPQFEVGRDNIKKGVVRDPVLHNKVIDKIKFITKKEGFETVDIIESPIKGVGGNKEFLIYLKKSSINT